MKKKRLIVTSFKKSVGKKYLIMEFGTLNSILSTTVSITYTCCYAIVLMLHNVPQLGEVADD